MPYRPEDWERYTRFEVRDTDGEFEETERQEARAMRFLREHLPRVDLDCYPAELFSRFARHAVSLRSGKKKAPWCAELDWEIFAHYVLFPRVNDEDLSFHREIFFDGLWPWLWNLPSMEERILAVNRWCCEQASYQAQDNARTASPLTVYRCGVGRCGELSAFLVSALRSVGIPARQVYAPRWSHCDDNHAWVEALCDGQWRFLGACEPEPELDRGWFSTAASRAVLVHSWVFGAWESPLHGEPLGTECGMTWFNQTARYADTREYTFRLLSGGKPAAGAKFRLQILNEASFQTIAVLTAGEDGTARAALGRGNVHGCACLDGGFIEGDYDENGLVRQWALSQAGDVPWTDFDVRAPAVSRPIPAPLSGERKAARAHARRQGADLRERRRLGYSAPTRPEWEDLRAAARGNWKEIRAFLEYNTEWHGASPERLVRSLPEKDLRDVTWRVLEDHFNNRPRWRPSVPEEIYWQYTACPRIGLEPLVPWREKLRETLKRQQKTGGAPEQEEEKPESSYAPMPVHGNLYWTPGELNPHADPKSARVYFAAAMRTQGWPARLSPLDGVPEAWENGTFRPEFPQKTGLLHLMAEDGKPLRAGQDWSISRWTEEGWEPLRPGDEWREGQLALDLCAGRYRIVTTVRLPSGDQLARYCEIALGEGEERTLSLTRRTWSAEDLLCSQTLPALSAAGLDGGHIPDLFRMGDGPVLALWLEEGGEPTEHLLGELMNRAEEVKAIPLRLLFLVRGRDSLSQPTLGLALSRLERVQVLLDDWAYDLEAAARCLGREPDSPPLAVLCDGAGRCLYSAAGYRAGGVELLLRAAGAAFPPG